MRTLAQLLLLTTIATGLAAGENPAAGAAAGAAPAAGEAVSEADLGKLLSEWGEAQKKLKTIVVKFKRSKTTILLDEPELTDGVIQIIKPDGYRQEVFEKTAAGAREMVGLIILKPPYVWVYTPRVKRAEQIDLTRLQGAGQESPLKALGDIISFDQERIRKRFAIAATRLAENTVLLEYTPLGGTAIGNLQKVRVWMKPGARFPMKRETVDSGGDSVVEEYSDPEFDKDLDAGLFTFKRPRGVELKKLP